MLPNASQVLGVVGLTFARTTTGAWHRAFARRAAAETLAEAQFEEAADSADSSASTSEPHSSVRWVPGLALRRFGTDLTELARQGKLDPVIGRDDVIARMLQVLLRRTKNNCVVVGEAGVGKTAVVEGVAQLIASSNVPLSLADKRIVSLDVTALVAGSAYRGEFEDRLQHVVRDVEASQGRIILFIDEIHMLVGAGAAKGGLDAANMLKPALARGRLRCIGATTLKEYRQHVESDAALARRFQAVLVEEPSPEGALACLHGLRARYESHHGVRFTEAALQAAVTSAHRYVSDRRLPDSALDLIDEAAAHAVLRAANAAQQRPLSAPLQRPTSQPPLQLELETRLKPGGALAGLQAGTARLLLERERRDLATPRACPHCATQMLARKGDIRLRCRSCGARYLALSPEKLQMAASLLLAMPRTAFGTPPRMRSTQASAGDGGRSSSVRSTASVAAGGAQLQAAAAATPLPPLLCTFAPSIVVDEADILHVVTQSTGIPADRLGATSAADLLRCEQLLHERVVGQRPAVAAVAAALRLWRAGMQPPGRPLASFVLASPPGVGCSTLCKALAEALFPDKSSSAPLVFNMSEFREQHTASKLLGAPPGYSGHGEGGVLTEAMRRRPHRLVVFKDVDRAHPEVVELLSRAVADGQLTDGTGTIVSFRSAILIFTTQSIHSNTHSHAPQPTFAAAEASAAPAPIASQQGGVSPASAVGVLSRAGGPAVAAAISTLCGHVDSMVTLQSLSSVQVAAVVDLHLAQLQKEHGISIDADVAARAWLTAQGYSPQHGLRPMAALIRQHVLAAVAEVVVRRTAEEGSPRPAGAVSGLHCGLLGVSGIVARVRCLPDGAGVEVCVEGQ